MQRRWTKADYEAYQNRRKAPSAQPQCPIRHESMEATEGKEGHPNRFLVRIESFRCRLLDPDNLCPKYFIDCLRYAGLIPNDRPQDVKLEVEQWKVDKKDEQQTLITVTPIP